MNLRDHQEDEAGKKVWLSQTEVQQLVDIASDTEHRIAFELGARCGLRSAETTNVSPQHVASTDARAVLRVPDGKGGKYRETPMPANLATTI